MSRTCPRSIRVLTILFVVASVFPLAARAQTAGATLAGRVVDQTGAAAPGATITVTNPSTGFTRSLTTDSEGRYRFPALPVGTYTVTTTLAGFTTVEQKGVELQVATIRNLDITVKVSSLQEAVTVTSEAAVVQNEPAIGTVVSQKELDNLPLNGRQFANLGVLAPGTSLAYNSDPTKPGQLTIALNGGIGRNVNYVIDGGDNTDDTIGGALQNFSIEGVQEFKIQTQQYKAEFGRSTGGVLTVVTKTGSNDFHASAFGFFRDKSFNSETESERLAGGGKAQYDRQQVGGSVSGPIVKDKVHFFGDYEYTRRNTAYTVETGGLVAGQDGQAVALPFRDHLAAAKVTANVSPTQFLQVRFGYQKNTDKYGASPLATPDSLGTVTNKYYSGLVGDTWTISDAALNEFVFQYTNFANAITPDSKNPTIYYPSGVHSGQNINTPQTTNQVKYQFKDDFSYARTIGGDRHDFKAGLNWIHEPTLGGDFSVGVDAPLFSMLEDRVGSPVTDITQYGGTATNSTPVDEFSVYLQDDWHVGKHLVLNLGVRYDLWTGFDLNQTSNPIWQALSAQTQYHESYLQVFQGGRGVLTNDKNNVAPRLGFTYDLNGEGKHFVRGGWGIYYDFPYTNATILFPASAVQSNYGVAYNVNDPNGIRNADGSFFQPGQPLPPNHLPGLASNQPNEVASPTLATPYSRQGSLGFSTEITRGFAVTVDVVNIAYRDIPYRFRANPNTGPDQPRRFPDFANFRLWQGDGFADYWGGNLGVRARLFSDKLTLQGFYTLSRIRGNVLAGADEFRLTDVNYQPDLRIGRDVSACPLDPGAPACVGPLNTDARHRVTIAATYTAPADVVVSGMFRYHSATPLFIYSGQDLNGDGFRIDLPPGVSEVNSGRTHAFAQLDLRASKDFRFGRRGAGFEILAEVFNVFNAKNPTGYVGNMSAANFGQPTSYAGDPLQGEQRLAQLSLRLHF
jgi:hypothetical protein